MALVEDVDPKEVARSIRKFADEIENGKFIAVAFAICKNEDGDGGDTCAVGPGCTPELIDEMLHSMKEKLFASMEAVDGQQ